MYYDAQVTQTPVTPLRVLCADDSVHVLAMLRHAIQSRGHNVDTAADGEQALARITAAPSDFDLVVTDSRMPRLDGFGLVEQLRATDYRGRIVVFATQLSWDERNRYRTLGVDKILAKPCGTRELIEAIEDRSV